jgi:hypothetical protein
MNLASPHNSSILKILVKPSFDLSPTRPPAVGGRVEPMEN